MTKALGMYYSSLHAPQSWSQGALGHSRGPLFYWKILKIINFKIFLKVSVRKPSTLFLHWRLKKIGDENLVLGPQCHLHYAVVFLNYWTLKRSCIIFVNFIPTLGFFTGSVCHQSSLLTGEGRGRAWSRIIRPQESLGLYKSFIPLWLKSLRSSVADPGCLSRIPDPDFYQSRISDPGSKNSNKR